MFYTREGVGRRFVSNANETKKLLERDYRVKIDLLGREWNDMTPGQQAALFNNYSHMVMPHGAQMANFVYSRIHTKIIEIFPGEAPPEPDLSLMTWDGNMSRPSDCHGHNGWFSSATRRMGFEYFVISDHSAHLEAPTMPVNISRFIPFVASRFRLQRRDNTVQETDARM